MNFSWPKRAAGKTARRSAARVGLAGFAVVVAAGAAALAAPAMSAMAATGDNPTTTAINLGEINTMPYGTFSYNVPVTVTDTVAGGPAPTGQVTITAPTDIQPGGVTVQYTPCTITLDPGADGVSTGSCNVTTPTNSYGFILIEANYLGDDNNAPSYAGDTNEGQGEVKIIDLMTTATTVSPATAVAGTVDLKATVLADEPGEPADANILNANSETLPDQVSFTLNGAPIGTCTDLTLGPAATDPTTNNGPNFADCDVTLAVGTYTVAATFSGDEYANTSTGTETLTVGPAQSATTTTMSGASGYVDNGIWLSAKVAGTTTPAGTVKFEENGKTLCSATLSNGAARCEHWFPAVGSQKVEAVYGGDATQAASDGTATVKVAAQPTSVKVTASDASKGKAVKITATVKSLTAATGTVTFYVNGHKVGTATVSGGKASFSYTWHATGTYTVTAVYGGSSTHLSSKGSVSVKVKS